mmetsp:Transcript_58334/g.125334  ORF Transcript_58334/g.125334 Transcript_58334/m.125334 type:complete len:174 (+) Transcript_58334:74-595(+)
MAAETGAAGVASSSDIRMVEAASLQLPLGPVLPSASAETSSPPRTPEKFRSRRVLRRHETMPWTPPRQGGELECPGAPLRRSRAATASDDEPECRRQKRCSNFFADEEMRPAEPRTPLRSRPREASSSGVAPQDGLLATPPPIKRHSAAVELGLDDTKGSEMPPLDAVPLLPM